MFSDFYNSDILLVAGLIIWPIGWDSVTIREVCGGSVGPYAKGNCTFGESDHTISSQWEASLIMFNQSCVRNVRSEISWHPS